MSVFMQNMVVICAFLLTDNSPPTDDSATKDQLRAFGALIRSETYSCPIATSATFLGKSGNGYAVRVTCSDKTVGAFYVPTDYVLNIDQYFNVVIRPMK
jgi:hypothetical protein